MERWVGSGGAEKKSSLGDEDDESMEIQMFFVIFVAHKRFGSF